MEKILSYVAATLELIGQERVRRKGNEIVLETALAFKKIGKSLRIKICSFPFCLKWISSGMLETRLQRTEWKKVILSLAFL